MQRTNSRWGERKATSGDRVSMNCSRHIQSLQSLSPTALRMYGNRQFSFWRSNTRVRAPRWRLMGCREAGRPPTNYKHIIIVGSLVVSP